MSYTTYSTPLPPNPLVTNGWLYPYDPTDLCPLWRPSKGSPPWSGGQGHIPGYHDNGHARGHKPCLVTIESVQYWGVRGGYNIVALGKWDVWCGLEEGGGGGVKALGLVQHDILPSGTNPQLC